MIRRLLRAVTPSADRTVRTPPSHVVNAPPPPKARPLSADSILPMPRSLWAEQVAEVLGVSKMTVYRLAEKGTLPGFRVGRNWRFMSVDVEAYLRSRRDHPAGKAL